MSKTVCDILFALSVLCIVVQLAELFIRREKPEETPTPENYGYNCDH